MSEFRVMEWYLACGYLHFGPNLIFFLYKIEVAIFTFLYTYGKVA